MKYGVKAPLKLLCKLGCRRRGNFVKVSVPTSREILKQLVLVNLGLSHRRDSKISLETMPAFDVSPLQIETVGQAATYVAIQPVSEVGNSWVIRVLLGSLEIGRHILADEIHEDGLILAPLSAIAVQERTGSGYAGANGSRHHKADGQSTLMSKREAAWADKIAINTLSHVGHFAGQVKIVKFTAIIVDVQRVLLATD